jgi:hypothetical protein
VIGRVEAQDRRGSGYYAHRGYGRRGLGGVLRLVIVIILVVWLLGVFATDVPVR